MGIHIQSDSIGERVVVALALLGLVVELVADPSCSTPPVSVDECVELCAGDVGWYGADGCTCGPTTPPEGMPEKHGVSLTFEGSPGEGV